MKIKFDILHNFISPVTGRILADPNYVLVGNNQGMATPSPALIDLRLDLINLRRDYNVCTSASFVIGFPNAQLPNAQVLSNLSNGVMITTDGIVSTSGVLPPSTLPNLTKGNLWIGDDNNRPMEIVVLPLANMANLSENKLWLGNSSNRPVASSTIKFDNLPNLSHHHIWIGDGSDRPESKGQIYEQNLPDLGVYTGIEHPSIEGRGKIWRGTFDPLTFESGTEKSDDLSLLEVDVEEINLEIDAIELEIAGIQGEIVAIQAQIATLQGQITALDAAVAALQTQVAIIDSQITDLNNRIDNLRLNTIPADGDVSFYNHKLINLANPVNPMDGVNLQTLEAAIGTATNITLTGFVEGGPPIAGVIDTIRTPGDLDMGGDRVKNLQQNPDEDFDAVSFTFLWDLMHDRVEILWP
ncbi:MAG TPA: hypothetical protein PKL04_01145 [Methanofastidiosum sp.]|nr:hypothetical protein [Methanofastidiosum sp.]